MKQSGQRLRILLLMAIALAPTLRAQPTPGSAPPDPTQMHLVYKMPGTERAKVREGVKFGTAEGRDLFVDVYQPADLKMGEQRAALLFISGGENVRAWPIYREYGRHVFAAADKEKGDRKSTRLNSSHGYSS